MTDPGRFAGRLKELRERAGWTQAELAQRAGLTKDGVAHLEQGRREPGWSTVLALADALGVGPQAFTEAPAERPPSGPGRPRKEETEAPLPKRPRGRPRKDQAADLPPVQEKPARRRPPRPRGG
jgi:transcriptional regulator with XRE-family HTH domain